MTPSGFSSEVPSLCLVWDASRLSQYIRDPLTFYWKNYKGLRSPGKALALTWGTLYHEAIGWLETLIFQGVEREEALRRTIRASIEAGLKEGLSVRGKGGDLAKRCVYSLIRAVVWWEAEYRHNPLPPATLSDGSPAIEFNFVLPLDMKAPTGEDYLLAGNIDKIALDHEGNKFAIERKTTTSTLGPYFFNRYDPCVQTYTYDLVCAHLFGARPTRGVIVEACQTAVDFSRFDRHSIIRTANAREHWLGVIKYWIKRAEKDALDNSWLYAMNTESSSFDSTYRDIQRRDPKAWNALLGVDLVEEEAWNPTARRPPLIGE